MESDSFSSSLLPFLPTLQITLREKEKIDMDVIAPLSPS